MFAHIQCERGCYPHEAVIFKFENHLRYVTFEVILNINF